ncbi:MAG: hypothetical protein PHE68_04640 [Candidatus Peribacteraceae bacterium]|nr:hypothetical protein [Candidatus Peribacteraceae bacterium]
MPLIKHTQNDIGALVNAASFLTEQRKAELLLRLPDYYQRVSNSLLLTERLATDLLFLFPRLSDDELEKCRDMLNEELSVFLHFVQEDLSGTERDYLLRSLKDVQRSSQRVLRVGTEMLDTSDEQKTTEDIEQKFSEQS